jgi:hypothetical protein
MGGVMWHRGWKDVEVPLTIAANDHGPGAKILNRKTKRVKFNGTEIINGETTNRDQVFD